MKNRKFLSALLVLVFTVCLTACVDDECHSDEAVGIINGHEYVDLGLGVKWATCNIGATSPEECGSRFAWGEVATKGSYSKNNCVTWGVDLENIEGDTLYDAASATWGGTWRMPTFEDFKELMINCKWTWTTLNGVSGYNVKAFNDNSIFLPVTGFCNATSSSRDDAGFYWSSTSGPIGSQYALSLFLTEGHRDYYLYDRFFGLCVRPVAE